MKISRRKSTNARNEFIVITTLLTLANAFCGFTAILKIYSGKPVSAGWFIILAIIFDALDGSIARLTKSSSGFGVQLDSLCDAISFGLAPAVILWYVCKKWLGAEPLIARIIWLVGVIYMTCAILRLARFNIQTGTSSEDHSYFTGLPTPGAAGFIATSAIFIYHKDKLHQILGEPFFNIYVHIFLLLIIVISILMVSSIRYVHFFSYMLHGKKSATRILEIILLISLILIKPSIVLWLIFVMFIFVPVIPSTITLEKKVVTKYQETWPSSFSLHKNKTLLIEAKEEQKNEKTAEEK